MKAVDCILAAANEADVPVALGSTDHYELAKRFEAGDHDAVAQMVKRERVFMIPSGTAAKAYPSASLFDGVWVRLKGFPHKMGMVMRQHRLRKQRTDETRPRG